MTTRPLVEVVAADARVLVAGPLQVRLRAAPGPGWIKVGYGLWIAPPGPDLPGDHRLIWQDAP